MQGQWRRGKRPCSGKLDRCDERIGSACEKESGDKILLSFAASSLLARQIIERAPADIFISADEAKMDEFAKAGLIATETRRDLLSNLLVIVAPWDSKLVIVSHITDFLQIGHLFDRHVRSLLRGENQRVVIERALLSSPRLLLLDERLSSLDAELKNTILQQPQALPGEFGTSMLFVTHDAAEAIAICEDVLLLQAGRITARGERAKLLS